MAFIDYTSMVLAGVRTDGKLQKQNTAMTTAGSSVEAVAGRFKELYAPTLGGAIVVQDRLDIDGTADGLKLTVTAGSGDEDTNNIVEFQNAAGQAIFSVQPESAPSAGYGKVTINGDLDVLGAETVSGNATFSEDVTIGDDVADDTVTFNAKLVNDILPKANSYTLGDTDDLWGGLYLGDDDAILFGDDQDISMMFNSAGDKFSIDANNGAQTASFELLSTGVDIDSDANITVDTTAATGANDAGDISITGGGADSGEAGSVTLTAGASTSGTDGNITLNPNEGQTNLQGNTRVPTTGDFRFGRSATDSVFVVPQTNGDGSDAIGKIRVDLSGDFQWNDGNGWVTAGSSTGNNLQQAYTQGQEILTDDTSNDLFFTLGENYTGADDGSTFMVRAGPLYSDYVEFRRTADSVMSFLATVGLYDVDSAGAIQMDAGAASHFIVDSAVTGSPTLTLQTTTGGHIFIGAVENVDINAGGGFNVDATGAATIDASGASNFTTDGGNLTLQTTTSGSININSVGGIDADAVGAITLDAGATSNFTTTAGDLTLSAQESGATIAIQTTSLGTIDIDSETVNVDAVGVLTLTGGTAVLQSAIGALSNSVTIQSGDASGGTSGDVILNVGSATGAQGDIEFQNDKTIVAAFDMGTEEFNFRKNATWTLLLPASSAPTTTTRGAVRIGADPAAPEWYTGSAWEEIGSGTTTLQEAYVEGNTITTSSGEGNLDVTIGAATDFSVILGTTSNTFFQVEQGADQFKLFDGGAGVINADIDVNTWALDSVDTSNFTMTANDAADKTLTVKAANSGAGDGIVSLEADGYVKTVDSSAAAPDGYFQGDWIIQEFTAGEAILAGDLIYLTNDGAGTVEVKKCQADDAATSEFLGVAANAAADTETVYVVRSGTAIPVLTGDTWGNNDAGDPAYMDPDTAGRVTSTAPTATSDWIARIGFIMGLDKITIAPQPAVEIL